MWVLAHTERSKTTDDDEDGDDDNGNDDDALYLTYAILPTS